MKYKTPLTIYGELFLAMSRSGIWPDDKVIADLEPKIDPEKILSNYSASKNHDDFDLDKFVKEHFTYQSAASSFKSDKKKDVRTHINDLWHHLKRAADKEVPGSTLIPLPYPYIVPGGRFNEIYYWDSFFTMLGLKTSGQYDVIENMVKNFAYFLDKVGFIPNGNRTYFLSRSQPPFFSLMVELLSTFKGEDVLIKYLPQLEKEYNFWMYGSEKLNKDSPAFRRCVLVEDFGILNRYFDDDPSPRAEMYATDVADAQKYHGSDEDYYTAVKSACESGWDFSSRWFSDGKKLSSIVTPQIIPVDLNCLIYHLENVISLAWKLKGNTKISESWAMKAESRKRLINTLFWSEKEGFYFDYNFISNKKTDIVSLAGIFPLFFNLANDVQAEKAVIIVESKLLKPGGVVTTNLHTGQQWDAPNGWAPLQYMTYIGCKNYGYLDLAARIKERWIELCTRVYENTGKMMEKYNVENTDLPSGGGEYPVQDGFGWTNGVLLYFMAQ